MSRDDAILSAYERLVEALTDDLLGASDVEVLASHTPAAARVAADALRHRLHQEASVACPEAEPPEPPHGEFRDFPHRPERKP